MLHQRVFSVIDLPPDLDCFCYPFGVAVLLRKSSRMSSTGESRDAAQDALVTFGQTNACKVDLHASFITAWTFVLCVFLFRSPARHLKNEFYISKPSVWFLHFL